MIDRNGLYPAAIDDPPTYPPSSTLARPTERVTLAPPYVSGQQLEEMGFINVTKESVYELNWALYNNGITSKNEIAHFLAQCAYESNWGLWLTELGNDEYFAANGYGTKYRGAGYIHLTWDYAYYNFSIVMGDPEIYVQGADYVAAHYAWTAAGWFWTNKGLNATIAAGATVRDVTRIVLGSYNTWEKRQANYDKIFMVLQ